MHRAFLAITIAGLLILGTAIVIALGRFLA
jgi:hypothetical protein